MVNEGKQFHLVIHYSGYSEFVVEITLMTVCKSCVYGDDRVFCVAITGNGDALCSHCTSSCLQ